MSEQYHQAPRGGMLGQIDEVSVLLGQLISDVSALKQGQADIQATIQRAVSHEIGDLGTRLKAVETASGESTRLLASYRTTGRNALAAAGLLGTLFGAFFLTALHRGLDTFLAWWGRGQ